MVEGAALDKTLRELRDKRRKVAEVAVRVRFALESLVLVVVKVEEKDEEVRSSRNPAIR